MRGVFTGIFVAAVVLFSGVGGCMYGYPSYNVYTQKMHGEAAFQRAEQDRRIAVLEAQAMKDSAVLKAEAEVERAKGVAQANHIVANSLGGPDGYLRYLYIQNIEQSKGQIIYIPTEGGLPILESGRHVVNATAP